MAARGLPWGYFCTCARGIAKPPKLAAGRKAWRRAGIEPSFLPTEAPDAGNFPPVMALAFIRGGLFHPSKGRCCGEKNFRLMGGLCPPLPERDFLYTQKENTVFFARFRYTEQTEGSGAL